MNKSIMWTYMAEEKTYLLNLLKNEENRIKITDLANLKVLYIVAHGSSYNAAIVTASILSKLCHLRVYVNTPSTFINNCFSLDYEDKETTYVLGISQTGTSRGVLEAVEGAKRKGFKLLSVTNVVDSPMDKIADTTLYLNCGEEESNAKTKGYSSTLVLLMKLAIDLALLKNTIDKNDYEQYYSSLKSEIEQIPIVQAQVKEWCEKNEYGKTMTHLYVLGNGINYGSALEGMLKLMETVCIPTMFSDIEEFSHGMHRSVNSNSFVLLLQSEVGKELMLKTFDYLNKKDVNTLMINANEAVDNNCIINVEPYSFDSSVLLITAAIQVISAFVPELMGDDPNRDANNDYTDYMSTRV